MTDYNCQFEAFADMNSAVRARLGEFSTTLQDFQRTYTALSAEWGGDTAGRANDVSQQVHKFGQRTGELVTNYLNALERHLAESEAAEAANARRFVG